MKERNDTKVHMVPITQITVVNSRSRGRDKFKQIVANISNIGLKKPVTLARREPKDGVPQYELVCGEGRIEAFKALGQTEVPALIIDATREEIMLMSLAENIARRSKTSVELAREIAAMQDRGAKLADIARKVDLDVTYVRGLLKLLKQGERNLITAVEHGLVPIGVAVTIAETPDEEIQAAMTDAYAKGQLKGRALTAARRLIEKRRLREKYGRKGPPETEVSANSLVRAYKKEATRQTLLVSRAKQCENRLRYVVTAMKRLLGDEGLVNLLRAEGLTMLPQYLGAQLNGQGVSLGK